MNDEIKEILELFAFANEDIMFCDIVELNPKQCHLLLDYITNLQEENEELNNIINELEKYHKIQMGIVSDEIDNQYCLGRYDSNYDSFQKLQELKGDSSDE